MKSFIKSFLAGHPPFLAESDEQIKERILTKDFPIPKIKGWHQK